MTSAPDISAVLVARDEGPRIGISLHSALDAAAAARTAGLAVEVLVVLARPSAATRAALAEASDHGARLVPVDAADAGAVRNAAVAAARGAYIGFLDGGAMWSENWLAAAQARCAAAPERVIAHPEIHWFYAQGRELYFPPDQESSDFEPALLQHGNCWDGQSLAAAAILQAVPFPELGDDVEPGRMEWEWNIATVAAGYVHRVVPATINFGRRRPRTLR